MNHSFKSHPWHGIEIGKDAPTVVRAFVEISPVDTIKYEVDKSSGYLIVDRPQKYSNKVPALYGFIPKTYCGNNVSQLTMESTNLVGIQGDGDPLDILVLTEHQIQRGDIIVPAIPIGGIRLIDRQEADDKIIAVMQGDYIYGHWQDISDVPETVITRLKHYFLTYKNMPDKPATCVIDAIYDKASAHRVIKASMDDYTDLISSTLVS
jgi:inorganic pyrophosphatase